MMAMGSTISYVNGGNNNYPSIMQGPKFATAKTLRLKRRNITITDGVTTPATLFTPAKTPKTPAKDQAQTIQL